MKIGVITFSQSQDNYGQILQCYAMQCFLQQLGHEPFLIRYAEPAPPVPRFWLRKLLTYLLHFRLYLRWWLHRRRIARDERRYSHPEQTPNRRFTEFLQQHLRMTPLYTREELLSSPPAADVYLCGSDQIWGGDDLYYLSFAPRGARRIAYAPSFGGVRITDPVQRRQVAAYLRAFEYIGMREHSGVEQCRELGRPDAEQVCDPTLLLSREDYDRLAVAPSEREPYLLLYLLGSSIDCELDDIRRFAAGLGKKLIYVASQGRYDDAPKCYPSIGEWLGLIRHADGVITNSFHGVVFSLIYHKPFLALALSRHFRRMNGRVEELLSALHMNDRICRSHLPLSLEPPLDFSAFDRYRRAHRDKTVQLFRRLCPLNTP